MEIKKIVLEIDDKEIELTMSQAKKLHENLNEIFGYRTFLAPSYPIIIERPRNPWENPIITYESPGTWISENTGSPIQIQGG